MATEIEIKAHVQDSEAIKLILEEKAKYEGSFEKEDIYWFFDGKPELKPQKLRIRSEKRSLHSGSPELLCFATCKNKEVIDGIEINEEHEFEVNPRSEFEAFIKQMGFKPGISKKKKGWAFSLGKINIELSDVEGLGWFVELEIVADNSRPETIAEAKKQLLDFLSGLGIKKEAIESRYYIDMLKELS